MVRLLIANMLIILIHYEQIRALPHRGKYIKPRSRHLVDQESYRHRDDSFRGHHDLRHYCERPTTESEPDKGLRISIAEWEDCY